MPFVMLSLTEYGRVKEIKGLFIWCLEMDNMKDTCEIHSHQQVHRTLQTHKFIKKCLQFWETIEEISLANHYLFFTVPTAQGQPMSGIPLSHQATLCKDKFHHVPRQCSMLRLHRAPSTWVFFMLSSVSLSAISSLLAFTKVKGISSKKKKVWYQKSVHPVSKQP